MKILSIVGARPQFIKAALVCQQLRQSGFDEILVHTGQHYDLNMSDVFFDELNIPQPEYHLGIGSGSHGKMTGKMLEEIEKVIIKEKPDMMLVYGDTNSTLAGSLAASKIDVPIAHVEAGLRSFNKTMPEEINRILTDHVSSVLFCPTGAAIENLRKEGFRNIIDKGSLIDNADFNGNSLPLDKCLGNPLVINIGDVMYDVARRIIDQTDSKNILAKYGVETKKYILVTIHRAENTDNGNNLETICRSLVKLANEGINVIFPVHPRTEKALTDRGINLHNLKKDHLNLTSPVPYTDMITLEANALSIITDSGGVQKEGYFFKVPCVIPRNETEWVELVDSGWNEVTGVDEDKIVEKALGLPGMVSDKPWLQYFGDGHAVERIVNVLKALG